LLGLHNLEEGSGLIHHLISPSLVPEIQHIVPAASTEIQAA
jgi:hypothetical protein